ncbi:MAG: hypothetical protein JOZ62_15000 [Acidobacteriaceae bacterium]|nr:hypothetical protein [Acidobacteriaceae bacterium]
MTKQSGKTRRVQMRNGRNQRVREACYHWARVRMQRRTGRSALPRPA